MVSAAYQEGFRSAVTELRQSVGGDVADVLQDA
jgi:hypothetical protein